MRSESWHMGMPFFFVEFYGTIKCVMLHLVVFKYVNHRIMIDIESAQREFELFGGDDSNKRFMFQVSKSSMDS